MNPIAGFLTIVGWKEESWYKKILKVKKMKSYQTGVCLIHYLAEFFSFPSLAVQKKREVYRDGQRGENVG